jgi:hypothetical protein
MKNFTLRVNGHSCEMTACDGLAHEGMRGS